MSFWSAAVAAALALLLGPVGRAPAVLRDWVVDTAASRLYVVTHRAGLLSFLGHDHAIVPLTWSAALCLADPIPAGAHATLGVRTASLVIDSDSARALAGLGGGPSPGDVAGIQRKLLDPDHLAADRYPEIRLELAAPRDQSDTTVEVRGTLDLHGVTRAVRFPVVVQPDGQNLRLSGTLEIRQSDFGVKPESIAGVVKVADRVDLHFALLARPGASECGPADAGRPSAEPPATGEAAPR